MSGTDPDHLPESMMELAVAIINGCPIHAKSPVLARKPQHLSSLSTSLSSCKIFSISNNSPQPLISLCF